jgi:hypothetical protein
MITMKNFKTFKLLFLALLVATVGCDTVDFGSTNELPNSPVNASTASLMTNAEKTVSGYIASTTSNMYVQYLSNGQYDEESRYQTLNWSFSGYYAALVDLQRIVDLNQNEDTKVAAQANGSNANQIAAATILRVYYLHGMTDRWGMLPYTEALQGLENQYPAFDSQQTIYNGLFAELDMALGMIDNGAGPVGDFMFGGDMDAWRAFGNTIKLVMGLRLSNADPSTGSSKFNAAKSGAITSNGQNLFYPYLNEDANDNPWQDRFETRRDYMVSDVLVNAMIGNGTSTMPEDPRLEKYAEPAFNHPGEYIGAFYGVANDATDEYSFITSDIIHTMDAPLYIYTAAEVHFAMAEAAELGWTSDDPAAHYRAGIMASMEQWGVDAADAQTYIDNHPYGGASDIAYEKWVALYMQGYSSWAEWRRQKAMGYEKPLTAPSNLLSNAVGIPQRHAYSATAGNLNEDNYNAAVAAQGPDNLDTVLWTNK